MKEKIEEMLNEIQAEEGHAAAWGGSGLVALILIVLLLVLIF